ncbi:MAG: hypothetical protein QM784_10005 [Polyangiaceae bacterium]
MAETPVNPPPTTEGHGSSSERSSPNQETVELLAQITELWSKNTSRMRIIDRKSYYSLIGEARQSIKLGDLLGARTAIALANQLLSGSINAVARAFYLGAALALGLTAAIIALCVYKSSASCRHCACDALAKACFCMAMGTLGAACSVIFRASTLAVEAQAGKVALSLEAVARILAGTMSGFLLYLVTRSNLIFSAEAVQKAPFQGHLLFAFAAGYVERFIPSVSQSLESFGRESDRKAPPAEDKDKPRNG